MTDVSELTDYEIAQEVLQGKWGNGATRKALITEAGRDYDTIQNIVNQILNGTYVSEYGGVVTPVKNTVKTVNGATEKTETETKASTEKKTLTVEYDPEIYDGIIVEVLY